MISRICEEFGCLPSEAMAEEQQVCLDIMELRAYARTKAQLDNAHDEAQAPKGQMADWVWRVQHDIAAETIARRQKAISTSG